MREFKIVIHSPDKVDMNNDILDETSEIYETIKKFKTREKAKKWLEEYIEILEMI